MTVSGAHDAAESIPVNSARHAECADCHNPHADAAQAATAVAPALPATLNNLTGWSGTLQTPAATESQLCYKCHADSTNKPASSTYGRTATRYGAGPLPVTYSAPPPTPADQYNLRLKFAGTVAHNVDGFTTATTANTTLRPFMLNVDGVTNNTSRPLTSLTRLYCIDCHNSDQARSSGGTGPNGPHGSPFTHLLQLNLYQEPAGGGGNGGASYAALCNKCHNLTTVRNVRPHNDHNNVACTTCHDPHGVIGGSTLNSRAFINFDTSVVKKSTTNFGYVTNGTGKGGCYLTCHGENHNPYTY